MSLSLPDSVSLAFFMIVSMALVHCLCASVVGMDVVGVRIWLILMFMWIRV